MHIAKKIRLRYAVNPEVLLKGGKMRNAFLSLWESIGAKGNAGEVYNDLMRRYGEPHRRYHNKNHIEQCLTEAREIKTLALNYPALEMALWFHDVIYDPQKQNNEERSAALAFITLEGAFMKTEFAQQVANLILATKHLVPPAENDEKFIVDIDLASFGLPQDRFDENTRLIRQEYDFVPTSDFITGRIKVLKGFLSRPSIYQTPFFQKKYEKSAQANLKHSVTQLSSLI